jgi:hypothetical protein
MAEPWRTVNPSLLARGMGKDEEKAKRLADALRENLRKRKAQGRAVSRESQPNKDPTQAASE